jgi:CheY-like chemotaxis protein
MTDARIAALSVLIVDDSRVVIKQMTRMLERTGLTKIARAASSSEAEEKMRGTRYDILFLDWFMAGKSGVALMEQRREDRAFDSVAFVIVSGEAGGDIVHCEAIHVGNAAGASWQSLKLA